MMVEDEFLETAKIFTRHLHIAEYEKLKEQIEARKKEQVQAPRPVVAGGKLSVEGTMKKKAEVQQKRQIKAIQDIFASQDDEDDKDERSTAPSSRPTSTLKRPLVLAQQDSDSENLDASKPTFNRPLRPIASNSNSSSSARPSTTASLQSATTTGPKSASSTPSFAKPALPSAKPRATASGKSRATPFDMLDDYAPRSKRPSAPPHADGRKAPTPTTTRTIDSFTPRKVSRPALSTSSSPSVAPATGGDTRVSGLSKETAERIARRKAEREKDGKKKNVGLDDIPTFLV
jgi:hypothetical protein